MCEVVVSNVRAPLPFNCLGKCLVAEREADSHNTITSVFTLPLSANTSNAILKSSHDIFVRNTSL